MSRNNEIKCDGCGRDVPTDGPILVLDYGEVRGAELVGPRDFCGIGCLKTYVARTFPDTGETRRKRA
jgi:hypothetical protein